MNKIKDRSKITSLHFTKTIAAVCILFVGVVAFLWMKLANFDSSSEAAYHKLMQSQDDLGNNYTSRQRREGVEKDFFFSENGQRLQMRLQSARTELALDHHDDQTEVVEQMHDVVCCIQEELFYKLSDGREALKQEDGRLLIKHADPKEANSWIISMDASAKPMQVIRLVKADVAFYYYKNSQFIAEDVRVTHYVASGHSIEQAAKSMYPIMGGVATWVEFSLGGNGINFKAYKLKAKFYAPRRGL
ncbi:MAG: hypothetical protein H0X29_09115 [Parachlamydiaceae bacterium]|nr:hypothetical protein [Parachlamydiaceae bacterium]